MNKFSLLFLLVLVPGFSFGQASPAEDSAWLVTHYTKKEVYITMGDGVKLFTTIYKPIDSESTHPILLNRTPYSIAPYGEDKFKAFWTTPYMAYFRDNYIMVLQDVRGKYMSEGEFKDVRPYRKDKNGTDESTDTYDAIDWLVKNVRGNNGKVGAYGISYPGFYATMAAISGHPALKAVSPQAPVTEWFLGDDFHHNGAFMEMDGFNFYSSFGKPRPKPTTANAAGFQYYTKDNYKFYLETGTLRNLANLLGDSIKFWNELYAHPNYDYFWKERNARNYVQHISDSTATLVVGGLFDAEDCYGAWNLYRAIDEKAHNRNKLVMGPWSHGGWSRGTGECLGNVRFGSKTSVWYHENIEKPFFDFYLQGKGVDNIKSANIFFSGSNEWRSFEKWPPANKLDNTIYLHTNGSLSWMASPTAGDAIYNKYTSDPAKPVPYADGIHMGRTREYMDDDQRFAERRPDVLSYKTDTLNEDVTLAGPVIADLYTSLTTSDADFIVKLIDVFPDNFSYKDDVDGKGNGKDYPMGGYEMLVRGEVMRGRYRKSFSEPEAFEPGEVTEVKYTLPDVAHVFKKGHRIMVQIQSTWFPLVDRNPQQFVDIYKCSKADFVPCDIKIFCSKDHPSGIVLPVVGKD